VQPNDGDSVLWHVIVPFSVASSAYEQILSAKSDASNKRPMGRLRVPSSPSVNDPSYKLQWRYSLAPRSRAMSNRLKSSAPTARTRKEPTTRALCNYADSQSIHRSEDWALAIAVSYTDAFVLVILTGNPRRAAVIATKLPMKLGRGPNGFPIPLRYADELARLRSHCIAFGSPRQVFLYFAQKAKSVCHLHLPPTSQATARHSQVVAQRFLFLESPRSAYPSCQRERYP
jgi:hypothetical protein